MSDSMFTKSNISMLGEVDLIWERYHAQLLVSPNCKETLPTKIKTDPVLTSIKASSKKYQRENSNRCS